MAATVFVFAFVAALIVMLVTHAWALMALVLFIALLAALCTAGYWYIEATEQRQAETPRQGALLERTDQRLSDTTKRMAESRCQLHSAAVNIDRTYESAKRRMETQAAIFHQQRQKGE